MRRLTLLLCWLLFTGSAEAQTLASPLFIVPTTLTFVDKYNQNFPKHFGWFNAQVAAANRAIPMGAGSPSRFPYSTVNWTVQPNDNSQFGNERNEVLEMFSLGAFDETPGSTVYYYGVSVYLPTGFTNDGGLSTGNVSWDIFMQLHGPDTGPCPDASAAAHSPMFDLLTQCKDSGGVLCNGIPVTHMVLGLRGGECASPTILYTDLGPYTLNTWMDFVFAVKWETDSTGSVQVWTRLNETGPLLQTQLDGTTPIPTIFSPNFYMVSGVPVTSDYWKSGIYTNAQASTVTVDYAGPISRATTFRDAAIMSFGSYP